MPPVSDRLRPILELDGVDGLSLDGRVRNANASFSVLKGMVTSAPLSSPSVTSATLLPGYFACSFALSDAMSDGEKPETEPPLEPFISDFGNRNFSPITTEPSALKV